MKRSATFTAMTLLLVLSAAEIVQAQSTPVATGVVVGRNYGRGWGGGGFYRPYQFGGGTVYGSYLRGRADVIRAQGEYNLNTSAAAINFEEARSMNLDNQVKYVETYFEKRRINSSERAYERRPHATPEQIARWNEKARPERLAEMELEFAADAIQWPNVLLDDTFTNDRDLVEAAVAARTAENSGLGSNSYRTITNTVDIMQAKLKNQIREMSPAEYLAATKFLESMGYEARFEVQGVGLASTAR